MSVQGCIFFTLKFSHATTMSELKGDSKYILLWINEVKEVYFPLSMNYLLYSYIIVTYSLYYFPADYYHCESIYRHKQRLHETVSLTGLNAFFSLIWYYTLWSVYPRTSPFMRPFCPYIILYQVLCLVVTVYHIFSPHLLLLSASGTLSLESPIIAHLICVIGFFYVCLEICVHIVCLFCACSTEFYVFISIHVLHFCCIY